MQCQFCFAVIKKDCVLIWHVLNVLPFWCRYCCCICFLLSLPVVLLRRCVYASNVVLLYLCIYVYWSFFISSSVSACLGFNSPLFSVVLPFLDLFLHFCFMYLIFSWLCFCTNVSCFFLTSLSASWFSFVSPLFYVSCPFFTSSSFLFVLIFLYSHFFLCGLILLCFGLILLCFFFVSLSFLCFVFVLVSFVFLYLSFVVLS